METRVCKKCGEEKAIDEFCKSPSCKNNRAFCCLSCKSKYDKTYNNKRYVPHPKIKPTKKICGKCGNEYPMTEEYFFIKKYKQKLANGDIKEYKSFRSVCKKCHGEQGAERKRNKRCIELKCTSGDYQKAWRKHMAKAKMIHPGIDFPLRYRHHINRKIKEGYKYTTYEQYKKDCQNNYMISAKRRRKYDYGDIDFITNDMRNKMQMKMMTDARLAQIMGMSVRDVPKELIKTKRLITILKREAGLTHSTKKHMSN